MMMRGVGLFSNEPMKWMVLRNLTDRNLDWSFEVNVHSQVFGGQQKYTSYSSKHQHFVVNIEYLQSHSHDITKIGDVVVDAIRGCCK